jgi:hypothetical protein
MGQFASILATHGVSVTWLQRQVGGSYIDKGSVTVIHSPARSVETLIESGHTEDDYQTVFAAQAFAQHDHLIFDGYVWEVQTCVKWENATFAELFYTIQARRIQT